jgi:hypothetical protein
VVLAAPFAFRCVFNNLLPDHNPDPERDECKFDVDGRQAAAFLTTGVLISAAVGHLLGARRTFDFGRVR